MESAFSVPIESRLCMEQAVGNGFRCEAMKENFISLSWQTFRQKGMRLHSLGSLRQIISLFLALLFKSEHALVP